MTEKSRALKYYPLKRVVLMTHSTILKNMPNAWQKIRLNTESAQEMKEALVGLIQQKQVSKKEAEKLGLWSVQDSGMMQELLHTGLVKIPVWRHAIINYPHPLLKNGLAVIDTPKLNALGAEPEITLSYF